MKTKLEKYDDCRQALEKNMPTVKEIAEVAYEAQRIAGDEWELVKHNVLIYEYWVKIAQAIHKLYERKERKCQKG